MKPTNAILLLSLLLLAPLGIIAIVIVLIAMLRDEQWILYSKHDIERLKAWDGCTEAERLLREAGL